MRTSIATVVAGTVLVVGTAGASLTQGACLAKKLKEWGKLAEVPSDGEREGAGE
jgi:hypothetical protein